MNKAVDLSYNLFMVKTNQFINWLCNVPYHLIVIQECCRQINYYSRLFIDQSYYYLKLLSANHNIKVHCKSIIILDWVVSLSCS